MTKQITKKTLSGGQWTRPITNADATEVALRHAKDTNAIASYWRFVGGELHQLNAEVRARDASAA